MANTTFNMAFSSTYLPYVSNSVPNPDYNQRLSWELQEARQWEQQLFCKLDQIPVHAALLRPLIAFLAATLRPARIYVTHHDDSATDKHFTVSVVLSGSAPTLDTLKPVLDIAYLQNRNAYCSLYNEGSVINDLKNYSFYAMLHFAPGNIVYDDSRLSYPAIEAEQLALAKQKAWDTFTSHFEKARIFLHIAQTSTSTSHELTLFLLHQAAELSCRAMLLSLGGLNIKEHSLQILFKHLRRHVPQLPALFDDEKDKPLLEALEKAYIASRYEAGFKANDAYIPFLLTRISVFLNLAETIVKKKTA